MALAARMSRADEIWPFHPSIKGEPSKEGYRPSRDILPASLRELGLFFPVRRCVMLGRHPEHT